MDMLTALADKKQRPNPHKIEAAPSGKLHS
jgi:hypothetical protein